MRAETTGFGGGKVILLGEHAVVHGTPAIAAGLRRGVTAVAEPADTDLLHVTPWGRTVVPDFDADDALSRAFAVALGAYRDRPCLRVTARVGLFGGAGLGCSAALGVAVLDAIDRALSIERPREVLGASALDWERVFHGSPSGIDNQAAARGGLIRFEQGQVRAVASKNTLHLVVAHSGERSDTSEMVARVRHRLETANAHTRGLFDEVRALVSRAESALLEGDVVALGRAFDENHRVLVDLGLGSARIESLRDAAHGAGALGAKVTGAGGGGCVIALARDDRAARRIASALDAETLVEEVAGAA